LSPFQSYLITASAPRLINKLNTDLNPYLVTLIDSETWIGLNVDVKGEIYEGLLQKNAEDTKSGAGQYFTPRSLIEAIVEVMHPQPGDRICDPACGTGGFFLIAHRYLHTHYRLDKAQKKFIKHQAFKGTDVADGVVRLCAMNLYLHGISSDESPIETKDSLMSDPGDRFEMVLTNPPFGKKSSVTIFNQEGKAQKEQIVYQRDDFFWLRDESLEDSDNLPAPEILATEIAEDLEAALELFQEISEDLAPETVEPEFDISK